MIRKQPLAPISLPFELWVRIFSHLDPSTPRAFTQCCKWFKLIGDDPHTRCAWLITKYGRALGLLHAFRSHRLVLNAEVGKLMVAAGCNVPRFLVQWVDKEYHRPDRTRRSVSSAVFVFFVNAGFSRYGADAEFKEDDVARFERSVYSQNTSIPETLDTIKSLIETFKFVPVRGFGSPIDETVYLVSKIDLKLITGFILNGLDLASVNDLVMERVLWRSDVSNEIVQSYLSVGFQLSAFAIKKGLQMARPAALEVLRAKVPPILLQRLAEETVFDMFGPSIRGWSFMPEALDFLTAAFPISEMVMEQAIFRLPGAPADLPDSFPATRCYMKANPCQAWIWVLRTYGPNHRFTMACFDDALSRAAAERDLHALHDVFLAAGVQFRPRHVKILACRVLHRDMTANALHLFQAMRAQVSSAYRATHAELKNWVQSLRDEITENEEWDHRMRTTQLEGGPRGGAYRISRAPEDGIRFLEEAREFILDLTPPPPSAEKKGKSNGRFRASVVIGRASLERKISSTSFLSSSPPGDSNRPIAALSRRNKGIMRRNSAPVPATGSTSNSSAMQTTQATATLPTPPIAGEPDLGVETDDEGNNDQESDGQQNPLADEIEGADQPTGPPFLNQDEVGEGRRPSRNGPYSAPMTSSGRAVEGLVRRISTWWSSNVASGRNGTSYHPWDRTAPIG
ncbi:hypothetical protein HDU67_008388 [Dinochytrium kinnereticum]|nr:hypothetical protein HDU67_008388 [Dinochytrium kinnereticum]